MTRLTHGAEGGGGREFGRDAPRVGTACRALASHFRAFGLPRYSTITTAMPIGAQSYIHSATSIGRLTQPWLIGAPKFSCQ